MIASAFVARTFRWLPAAFFGAAIVLSLSSARADEPAPRAAAQGVYQIPSNTPSNDEQRLQDVLRNGRMPPGHVEGRVYIPDQRERVLIQPQGREFRDFHVGGARWLNGGLIVIAIALMALLYVVRGADTVGRDPQGRRILRFRAVDRFVHWLTAVSFVVLALTGLNLLFGRPLIEPWLGDAAFAAMTHYGKLSHNFVGYAFLLGILGMAVMWMQDNIPHRVDLVWLRRGGGLLSGEHVPAEKFNAGQKMIFWIALLGGGLLSATGILLMFPFQAADIGGMQIIQIVHSVLAGLMIATIIGHVYLGTLGVRGSFDAMANGTVDLQWAKTHHPLWVEREAAKSALHREPGGPGPSVGRAGAD
jgi:formate dehydrogenase subunit gamma